MCRAMKQNLPEMHKHWIVTLQSIELLCTTSVSLCVSSQYWTAEETGRLPRGCRPWAGTHSKSRSLLRPRCLEIHRLTRQRNQTVNKWLPSRLSLSHPAPPSLLNLPRSSSPPSPLSPLRTHSPEWMLMVVPTRLLFLCLFSHRKSMALRAWACQCEEGCIID